MPRAILFSNPKPSAQTWAWNFTRSCKYASYLCPAGLQCRYINDDSRLEKNLERGYKGNWHLSSMIFVFSEGEDGSISEGLQGGIIYHNYVLEEGTRAPALGQFLSGELTNLHFSRSTLLALSAFSITPTFLRVLEFRYSTRLGRVTFCVLSSCSLVFEKDEDSQLDKDWSDAVKAALGG